MERLALAAAFYAIAFVCIWAGVESAPATGWPVTSSEFNGCGLLILGMIAKLAGHGFLLSQTQARVRG